MKKKSKRVPKGPPKVFETSREAKSDLTNLADSLANHSFGWPAAAIRSYLAGGSATLDEAFGVAQLADKAGKAKQASGKSTRPAASKRRP